ncbi:MAG TPA: hypothetical protein VM095_05130 [Pyrinomonadaceae bacterium]|nr:hypothetical protein [Pyrinomonadaceae bacterium]
MPQRRARFLDENAKLESSLLRQTGSFTQGGNALKTDALSFARLL